jgi:hypothetical protein
LAIRGNAGGHSGMRKRESENKCKLQSEAGVFDCKLIDLYNEMAGDRKEDLWVWKWSEGTCKQAGVDCWENLGFWGKGSI